MKTDRELLKLAAKAHGSISFDRFDLADVFLEFRGGGMNHWNPLTDDGDALRLAHALGMQLNLNECNDMNDVRTDIVRAAASIGEQMK